MHPFVSHQVAHERQAQLLAEAEVLRLRRRLVRRLWSARPVATVPRVPVAVLAPRAVELVTHSPEAA